MSACPACPRHHDEGVNGRRAAILPPRRQPPRHGAPRRERNHNARRGVPTFFKAVNNGGDTDYLARLWDGIAVSSEASTEPPKLTTYNVCFETVDGLPKENPLGALMSWQSFQLSATSLRSASRRQSPQMKRYHQSPSALRLSPPLIRHHRRLHRPVLERRRLFSRVN